VRVSSSPLRWMLPRAFRRPRPVSVLDVRFATHLAAVLGLAARGDGPAARRIRAGLQELHLPQRVPWWLNDSLESFANLAQFTAPGTPWHPTATLPRRFLCLPSMCELSLAGAGLGDHRLATAEWHLPSLTRLSLEGNALAVVPEQVLTLGSLEVLFLLNNPIREVPAALAALPRLRHIDLRRTGVTELPRCFRDRPGLHVQLGG
jgi:Leucine-rich repeat (LRR) protein